MQNETIRSNHGNVVIHRIMETWRYTESWKRGDTQNHGNWRYTELT